MIISHLCHQALSYRRIQQLAWPYFHMNHVKTFPYVEITISDVTKQCHWLENKEDDVVS